MKSRPLCSRSEPTRETSLLLLLQPTTVSPFSPVKIARSSPTTTLNQPRAHIRVSTAHRFNENIINVKKPKNCLSITSVSRLCNFRAGSDDDLTAFPDSAKIKYEAVLDERYFYTNSLIYTYVEKRQSFCTMYALGGAVDIFALSLSPFIPDALLRASIMFFDLFKRWNLCGRRID